MKCLLKQEIIPHYIEDDSLLIVDQSHLYLYVDRDTCAIWSGDTDEILLDEAFV